jgi:hypothetical protein
MAIVNKPKTRGIEIDLTGPQGNAYFLLGTAKNLAKQLELNGNEVLNEMRVVIMRTFFKCLTDTLVVL